MFNYIYIIKEIVITRGVAPNRSSSFVSYCLGMKDKYWCSAKMEDFAKNIKYLSHSKQSASKI
jgi:hypothetical protein